MYRSYQGNSGVGGGAMATTVKTIISVISTAAIKPYIYDWTLGTIGTPADNVMTVSISRLTNMTAGTSCTTVTADPLEPGDAGSTSTLGGAWTTEPTVGVTLFSVGQNQRATYRWVAAPGGELICPSTANAGIGLRALSPAYTGDAQATIYYKE